jgi:WD40 repeat protein
MIVTRELNIFLKIILLCVVGIFWSTGAMLIQKKVEQKLDKESLKGVWVLTADGVMQLPKWKIDQMKVPQVLYIHQKDTNSRDNPVDISHLSIEGLALDDTSIKVPLNSRRLSLVMDALEVAGDKKQFERFCESLTRKEKRILVNMADVLQATGITELLATIELPPEAQDALGGVIQNTTGAVLVKPVIKYLQSGVEAVLRGHKGPASCVAYSPDSKSIVSGSDDGTLIIWNANTGEEMKKLEVKGSNSIIEGVAYSPNGQYIVSGSRGKTLIIWDAHTGKEITSLIGHTRYIRCVAYSPDGNCIVSGAEDETLIIWDAHTGQEKNKLIGQSGWIQCVAYSPDSKYIVSGSGDGNLIIWDAHTGKEKNKLIGHERSVNCVAYSPDGNCIISGSDDGTLIIWNADTGGEITSLMGHSFIECVTYSPDGNHIVSGSADETLIMWNALTYERIVELKGHTNTVNCVAYSPDGKHIVSGSEDKTLIIWKKICPPEIISYLSKDLDLAQAVFLYRLYTAKLNKTTVELHIKDPDYGVYYSLPQDVQRLVLSLFPLELPKTKKGKEMRRRGNKLSPDETITLSKETKGAAVPDIFTHLIEEKIGKLKSIFVKDDSPEALLKTIEGLEKAMKNLPKDSVDYKACETLIDELGKKRKGYNDKDTGLTHEE